MDNPSSYFKIGLKCTVIEKFNPASWVCSFYPNLGWSNPAFFKVYEAWTLKTAANQHKPLLHFKIITEMRLQAIHPFIKTSLPIMTVLGSCFYTLFTVWQWCKKFFCLWLIWFVECGVGPFKMRKQQQHAAGYFLGVVLWKDS